MYLYACMQINMVRYIRSLDRRTMRTKTCNLHRFACVLIKCKVGNCIKMCLFSLWIPFIKFPLWVLSKFRDIVITALFR